MTLEETVDLLTAAAAFDQRTVGEADAIAWHAALGDLDFADARTAVICHYRDSRDRVMPADIRARVKAVRRDRLDRQIVAAPSAELAGSPRNYRAALMARIRQIADGRSVRVALGPGPREGAPPQVWADAKAALSAATERPLTPQEKARQQAEESRKARETAGGQEPAA